MNENDVLQYIQDYCNDNEEEVIIEGNRILDDIENGRFVENFKLSLEEYAAKYNKCPECGRELKYNTYTDEREYQGFPTSEVFYNKYCPVHGDLS
ncbi:MULTISPECIES: hypothetical protein [unclassified Clostridium]|uniref:hypothetical protein n=1 Tax=unclassified Clostridium TaxID=2614128 RepID=UPI0025C61905|nr:MULTISPECIES: hypothetical protein [unclassified Clostridium]